MTRLLGYELKKIVKRPFTIVVAAACLLFLAIVCVIGTIDVVAYAWGPDVYGSYENIPKDKLEFAQEKHGMVGSEDGAVVYLALEALKMDKKNTERFEGSWDDASFAALVAEYQAFVANPDNYTGELDATMMQFRRWGLLSQGMSDAQVDAYDAENPIYVMKPEVRYGEWQEWGNLSMLLEEYIIGTDGSVKSFAEAFPQVAQPAAYGYHYGPARTTDFQGGLVGILIALLVLAGLAPMFCDEVVQNTEPMLLAAKYGRDRLVRAKLLAGLLYTVGCVVLFTLVNLLICGLLGGFEGWNMPVQLDYGTFGVPFAASYLGLLGVQLGWQLLGAVALAALVLCFSAVMRSPFPVVFAGGIFHLIDSFVAGQAVHPWRGLAQLLPGGALSPGLMVYEGFNPALGALPLPQWAATLAVCLALIIGCGAGIGLRYRRK